MLETFKIKYLGHQPPAKISDRALDRIIQRDFGNNFQEVKQKLEFIKSDTPKGKNRLSAAVLKLANGDLTKIDSYLKICNNDFRDVVSKAEYPKISQHGFGKIARDKLKAIYLSDWIEYSNWLNKK